MKQPPWLFLSFTNTCFISLILLELQIFEPSPSCKKILVPNFTYSFFVSSDFLVLKKNFGFLLHDLNNNYLTMKHLKPSSTRVGHTWLSISEILSEKRLHIYNINIAVCKTIDVRHCLWSEPVAKSSRLLGALMIQIDWSFSLNHRPTYYKYVRPTYLCFISF